LPPLPDILIPYWDQTDNFDSNWNIVLAEDFDGPYSHLRSWTCPTCNDWWKLSIRNMDERRNPCKFCNPIEGYSSANRMGFPHIDGRNSVASEFPHIAEKWCLLISDDGNSCFFVEADGSKFMWPEETLLKSHVRVAMQCPRTVNEIGLYDENGTAICRHIWSPRISSQCSPPRPGRSPANCPSCTKGGMDVNSYDMRNALSVTNPIVGMELLCHPRFKTADEIKPGSDRHCWWQCIDFDENGNYCGHIFRAQVNPRTKNSTLAARTECPACENLEVHDDGRNSLATRFPNAAIDWDYDENGDNTPDNVTFGRTYLAQWRCQKTQFTNGEICNHPSPQKVYSKTQFLTDDECHVSCDECCPGGAYKRFLPGYFYVLKISSKFRSFISRLLNIIGIRFHYPLYKCGISNVPLQRLYRLAKSLRGHKKTWRYELVSIHYHQDGEIPHTLEYNMKYEERKRRYERVAIMPFDGGDEVYIRDMWDFATCEGFIVEGWDDCTDELRSQVGQIFNRFN